MDELDMLLPASIAMFTEEVGVSPVGPDGGAAYRARVAELIRAGRSFARIEDGQVVFKAEIGAVTPLACQVQGVWVPPELRGRGHATRGMAAVVGRGDAVGRPGGEPVRQRLQHPGPGRLPAGRLHRGRHVHVGAVLTAADGIMVSAGRPRTVGPAADATGPPPITGLPPLYGGMPVK